MTNFYQLYESLTFINGNFYFIQSKAIILRVKYIKGCIHIFFRHPVSMM